ncbi:hypothetical protein [Kitasatospora sp. NPDC088783]|uniref:hypothetical protein n=1 Tax=Kitasatospora sp. NPDC088783 TaxID=3364077 RepID=UPI0038145AB4
MAPRWPTRSALSIGDTRSSGLCRAERYVLKQYRFAIRAALTAAELEPIHEAQEYLYFPFASRGSGPLADGLPPTAETPPTRWQLEHGLELSWYESWWRDNRKGWAHDPLDIWSGADWERHELLPLPLFAHPEDIVDVVRRLLEGSRSIAPAPGSGSMRTR